MAPLIIAIVFIAIGYFIILRPQQERLRAQRRMVESLQVGDRVITAGGVHGTLTAVDGETVRVLVAPSVELTVVRLAIGRRVDEDDASSHELDTEQPAAGDPGAHAEDNVNLHNDEPELGGPA